MKFMRKLNPEESLLVTKVMREAKVEEAHKKKVKNAGGRSYKFVSPGRCHVPDDLDLFPIECGHEAIVSKYVRFTECKRPKKKPRKGQLNEIERIRAMGFVVDVLDRRD